MKFFAILALVVAVGVTLMSPDALLAETKADRYRWYDLTATQSRLLTAALKAIPDSKRKPVDILCDPAADCLSLAQDFDTAFEFSGWKSEISRPGEIVNGLHCTDADLAAVITKTTGIKVIVDPSDSADEGKIAINFGRKRVKP